MLSGWARTLRDVLRAAGDDPLVTLGQDEGGVGYRASQQVMAESLDYTSVHTWWNNDDLLWDGVLTKVPEKPNVHQETGLMSLEDMDGFPWRTPQAAADLLERKFAYSFASRGAGAIEWAWNVNPYQPIDNEATIGFFRPDGTAKTELRVVPALAAFFREAAPYLDDFEPDPVVLVVPHSRLFLGRPGGIDATKVVVRLLSDRFGVVPTAISDLRLTAARLAGVKLVLVPSPEVLDERVAAALLAASKAGTKVLVTGAVDGDSYGLETPSLRELGLLGPARALALRESTPWSPERVGHVRGSEDREHEAEPQAVALVVRRQRVARASARSSSPASWSRWPGFWKPRSRPPPCRPIPRTRSSPRGCSWPRGPPSSCWATSGPPTLAAGSTSSAGPSTYRSPPTVRAWC